MAESPLCLNFQDQRQVRGRCFLPFLGLKKDLPACRPSCLFAPTVCSKPKDGSTFWVLATQECGPWTSMLEVQALRPPALGSVFSQAPGGGEGS